jgi:hypothetical protein
MVISIGARESLDDSREDERRRPIEYLWHEGKKLRRDWNKMADGKCGKFGRRQLFDHGGRREGGVAQSHESGLTRDLDRNPLHDGLGIRLDWARSTNAARAKNGNVATAGGPEDCQTVDWCHEGSSVGTTGRGEVNGERLGGERRGQCRHVWDLFDGGHKGWNVVPSVLLVDGGAMSLQNVRPGRGDGAVVTTRGGRDG